MPALKGVGLLKGLGVTLKTMTRPAATRQYPHVKPDLPARTRGVIALIEENCTVCMLCARECPDWCIYIDSHKEQVAPKEGGRARTRNILDRFAIDFALCMYCGICVEVCPFDALHWSPEFEYATDQIEKLTHEMDTLRQWAYTVPAPDPLEEGAVEAKEVESARKAREARAAKAAAAAEEARAAAPPAASTAAAAPAAGAVDSRERPPSGSATLPRRGPEPAARSLEAAPGEAAPGEAAPGEAAPGEAAPGGGAAAPAAAARPADVEVEPGIDQEVYDRLLAAGESDRTARARAKASYMRKAKAEARAAAGAAPAPAAPAEAAAPPQAPAGGEAPATEPGSVEAPAAAVSAPETAPAAPAAAGTPEVAEPAPDARDPEARAPEGEATAAATAVDVAPGAATAQADAEHLEVEVDQETYDRLIEAGEPERTARAKAKAAYARKLRAAQRGEGAGPGGSGG
jgi:formate hydrogenlyase subunit 6/NADH:ubiquinone oxidoreductase subunit I